MSENGDLNTTENFSDKYEQEGIVGSVLIRNFYRSIGRILPEGIKKVLEVACGPGYSTHYLRPLLPNVSYEASEYYDNQVRMAKERNPGIPIIQESLYELKRKDESYDLVIALEVLEHLEDPRKALEEMHRVTKKYALLSVPREPLWRILNVARGAYLKDFGNTPGHINHWSTDSFKRFAQQKFDVQKVVTPLPWTVLLLKKKHE